jgi:hypothetical protein
MAEARTIADELRQKLFDWMAETRDIGMLDEPEIVARAAQYGGVSYEVGLQCKNFERIIETADLPRLGEEGKAELIARLNDPDSAVRFWAVTGLTVLAEGPRSRRERATCSPVAPQLRLVKPLLDDPSISVALAAGDYLVRAGEGAAAIPAFVRGLESEILWARIRAGAYLSYRSPEELAPMKPLLPALQAAIDDQRLFGPEHNPHIETNVFNGMLNGQRDVIARRWVLERVMKRIELAGVRA